MTAFAKIMPIAAAAFLAASASFAQETAVTPPTKETAKLGEVYLAEKSDPWELRCTKGETEKDSCQIFQLLKDETGGAVAEFNMFEIPDGNGAAAGAMVIVPLETLLETGLVIQVDDNAPRAYPFAYCNSYGCNARVGFTAEELDMMKSGDEAVVTIVPALASDVKVTLKLSLSGFTDMIAKTAPVQ